ncbi:hypothetical protein GGR52DRAFT_224588 [Hypoxylon sp. FL1284]|nr:hypothetical protein GGR52DRAFT_224588 [Hypoxylon sp. FL1284]
MLYLTYMYAVSRQVIVDIINHLSTRKQTLAVPSTARIGASSLSILSLATITSMLYIVWCPCPSDVRSPSVRRAAANNREPLASMCMYIAYLGIFRVCAAARIGIPSYLRQARLKETLGWQEYTTMA